MGAIQEVNYTCRRGDYWSRLVIVKDERSKRKRSPTAAAASIRLPAGTSNPGDWVIPATVTSEGGVRLDLTPENTEWLEDGEYAWDMVATVSQSALLTSTPLEETVTCAGTITVSTYDNITPMASDGVTEALIAVGA